MTTTPTLEELYAARRASWADLNSAWDADDDAHRAAWNAAVRRAALDKELK